MASATYSRVISIFTFALRRQWLCATPALPAAVAAAE